MMLEIADCRIAPGSNSGFGVAFATAQAFLAAMPGYSDHELQRCIEDYQWIPTGSCVGSRSTTICSAFADPRPSRSGVRCFSRSLRTCCFSSVLLFGHVVENPAEN